MGVETEEARTEKTSSPSPTYRRTSMVKPFSTERMMDTETKGRRQEQGSDDFLEPSLKERPRGTPAAVTNCLHEQNTTAFANKGQTFSSAVEEYWR